MRKSKYKGVHGQNNDKMRQKDVAISRKSIGRTTLFKIAKLYDFSALFNDTHLESLVLIAMFDRKKGRNPEPLLCKICNLWALRLCIKLISIISVWFH